MILVAFDVEKFTVFIDMHLKTAAEHMTTQPRRAGATNLGAIG